MFMMKLLQVTKEVFIRTLESLTHLEMEEQ